MLSSDPLISVVIPVFNREGQIARAISSVIAQTYQNLEIIVVDNHSEDQTLKRVEEFRDPRIRVYLINNHGKVSKSRNYGVKKSKGTYVAFLDSDDYWDPNKLKLFVDYGLDYDLWFSNFIRFDENGQLRNIFIEFNLGEIKKSGLQMYLYNQGNKILPSAAIVRREKILEIGFFDEINYIFSDDYDFWLRLSEKTELFFFENRCLSFYFYENSNNSNTSNITDYYYDIKNLESRFKASLGCSDFFANELAMCEIAMGRFWDPLFKIVRTLAIGGLVAKRKALRFLILNIILKKKIIYNP